MTKLNEIYKCNICGNIIEMLHAEDGELVCCGEPMQLLEENSVDADKEKHVPVIEKINGGVLVKVGSVDHPMIDAHYIEWIEILTDKKVYREYLNPGDKPQAQFLLEEDVLCAREFCNVHLLWRS